MPTELKQLRISRVSLVDKGANPGARIVLWKRDEPRWFTDIAGPLLKMEDMEPVTFDQALAESESYAKTWEMMDAIHPLMESLRSSVRSIFEHSKGDERKAKLGESVKQFLTEMKARLDPITKAQMKTEDGEQYPAAAFAYVPDTGKPNT